MKKIDPGDIFQFDISSSSFVRGQVIESGDNIYITIFNNIFNHNSNENVPLDQLELALCGWTLDGRIYNGNWMVTENLNIIGSVPRPCYKVNSEGVLWVEGFDGGLIRPATSRDSAILDYRVTFSPIRFERAIKALHGLEEWDASFDKMRIDYSREREG